jgi:hypothetical protein
MIAYSAFNAAASAHRPVPKALPEVKVNAAGKRERTALVTGSVLEVEGCHLLIRRRDPLF